MSAKDRIRWDDIYTKRNKAFPQPDTLLLDYVPTVDEEAEMRALDLACGLGQNGIWLAEQGYIVDLMDISRVGLRRARAELMMRNLRSANLLQVDIDKLVLRRSGLCDGLHDICPETYDVIAVFRYLRRPLFPIIKEAIKSGGRLIYETFNQQYLQQVPEFNQDFLLADGELETVFSDWRIVYHDESSHVTQLVAVKP
ncbi:MAG: hypothetical protein AAFV93_11765 [Chloroflexota bacterium]